MLWFSHPSLRGIREGGTPSTFIKLTEVYTFKWANLLYLYMIIFLLSLHLLWVLEIIWFKVRSTLIKSNKK